MILTVTIDDRTIQIDVPSMIFDDGEEFFQKLDRDMDKGWQMSREYVEDPNVVQRCQIAADRILTALHQNNKDTMLLMAGYILSRMPKVSQIKIDNTGNIQDTEFSFSE